jgi:hypothetical protein
MKLSETALSLARSVTRGDVNTASQRTEFVEIAEAGTAEAGAAGDVAFAPGEATTKSESANVRMSLFIRRLSL